MPHEPGMTIYDCNGYGCGHQPCTCAPPTSSEDFLTRRVAERGAEIERLRAWLVNITEVYDIRSELFTSDADCAASLSDRARAALQVGRHATDAF